MIDFEHMTTGMAEELKRRLAWSKEMGRVHMGFGRVRMGEDEARATYQRDPVGMIRRIESQYGAEEAVRARNYMEKLMGRQRPAAAPPAEEGY